MVRDLSCYMAGITFFCFIALLLVACDSELAVPPLVAVPSTTSLSATSDVDVLTFWHALPASEAQVLQNMVDEWGQKEQVRVELSSVKDEETLHQFLLVAALQGTAPTLAFARPSDMAQYIKADALLPLDSLHEEQKWKDDDSHFFDVLDYAEDSRLYGWPIYRHQTLLFMNRSLVSQVGSVEPTSWDDLLNTCAAFLEKGGNNCLAMYPERNAELLWLLSHSGHMVDETGKNVLFDDTLKEVLDWLAELRALGGVYQAASYESQWDAFINGETLFTFDSTEAIPDYEARMNSAFDLAIVPHPFSGEAPITVATGGTVVAFRHDERENALAKEFMRQLTEESVNSRWARAFGEYPAQYRASAHVASNENEASPIQQGTQSLSDAGSEPMLVVWPQIKQVLAQAMLNVINGSQTPEEAYQEAILNAESYLSQ